MCVSGYGDEEYVGKKYWNCTGTGGLREAANTDIFLKYYTSNIFPTCILIVARHAVV